MKNQCPILLAALPILIATHAVASAAARPLTVAEALNALGKGPALGVPGAPVTIVEFSDFRCGFCKKFWAETLPQLRDSYVKQGQVRFMYRHFAILGKVSEQAAMATECAGEQGKFWEYHDRLFADQGLLTQSKLKQEAQATALKTDEFNRCLADEKYRKKIENEAAVGAFLGVRGTPAFFVNERLLVGAQPLDVFQRVIEEELQKKTSVKKSNAN
jgi:protein-disulfide isomerase